MTATAEPRAPRPMPRPFLRLFWAAHRALFRLTGGRIGLSRASAGKKFGLMRLTTVGRRSGQRRVAMVGYYPDGANLVTLAMNGWGEADPAWWLNLQAEPAAIVDLPAGTRAVRGRAAEGEERERLWAGFRDYPGWGDVEAFAGRRARQTAVVVLEPA